MTSGGGRAPKGARSLLVAQASKAGVLLLGTVVLSRLLSPADFGYVAVAVAIVGVGEILRDMGLSTAAITNPNLSTEQRDVLFWANLMLGVVIAGVVIATAPLLAILFANDKLALALPVLSSVFLLNGIGAQYRADLNRHMRFRAMSAIDAVAPLSGVVSAIALAAFGAGYWALVAQPIVVAVVTTVSSVILARWIPRLPRNLRGSVQMLKFGAHVSWSQITSYLGNNVDTFALGLVGSPAALGYYNRAYQVTVQPLALLKQPATSIALPLLSRRRGAPESFVAAAVLGQTMVAYTVVPIGFLLAACAEPVVAVFLGSQWTPAVPIVAILSIVGAAQQIAAVSSWMFLSSQGGRQIAQYSSLSLAVKAVSIISVAWLGPTAVAVAFLASTVILTPIAIIWASRVAKASPAPLFIGMARPLLLCAMAGAFAAIVVHLVDFPALLEIMLGIAVFIATAAFLAIFRAYRLDFMSVIRVLAAR